MKKKTRPVGAKARAARIRRRIIAVIRGPRAPTLSK